MGRQGNAHVGWWARGVHTRKRLLLRPLAWRTLQRKRKHHLDTGRRPAGHPRFRGYPPHLAGDGTGHTRGHGRRGPPLLPYFGWRTIHLATNPRSEEHTSELPSLMRISYAVFCLTKKKH